MQVTVNGKVQELERQSVAQYLATLGMDADHIAVELNLDILPKAAYAATMLNEGDRLEIVRFVGGG